MSFFDLFFPQQASAMHLGEIAAQGHREAIGLHRERIQTALNRRSEISHASDTSNRVSQLERDLGHAGLVIEALLQMLEASGTVSRDALAARIKEIDARDGTADGRMTPPPPPAFTPSRSWPAG